MFYSIIIVDSGRKWQKVGNNMFIGEYQHTIDDKNRIVVPTKYRSLLGEKFIITRGLEKCLYIMPLKEWEVIMNKLKTLPFTKKDARTFSRYFLSGASTCEFDKSGRISITSPLALYAGLEHDCVFIGVNDRIELWSKEKFDQFMDENIEEMENIAEHLFDNDYETL